MLSIATNRVIAALRAPRLDHRTATARIRFAIQLMENLLEFGVREPEDRRDVRAATRQLWAALHQIERGNP